VGQFHANEDVQLKNLLVMFRFWCLKNQQIINFKGHFSFFGGEFSEKKLLQDFSLSKFVLGQKYNSLNLKTVALIPLVPPNSKFPLSQHILFTSTHHHQRFSRSLKELSPRDNTEQEKNLQFQ
jgi:hypothetical protein